MKRISQTALILSDHLFKQATTATDADLLNGTLSWLCDAQDHSQHHDGGVARDFDLRQGWASSYPETTGYIIPTFLEAAIRLDRPDLAERAERMLDWLSSIQLDSGAFQGGKIDQTPVKPVTFNTGQILLGLSAGLATKGKYEDETRRAADWLVATQDGDGCWRKFPTPFAKPGEKAYETHVAWGLFEADRVLPERGYGAAGLKNVDWALTHQTDNGWFEKCCLEDPRAPLTHTLGYVLKGITEAHRFSQEEKYLIAAAKTAQGLLTAIKPNGKLPGRLSNDWKGAVKWTCLTGSSQIAWSFFYLYQQTGDTSLRQGGERLLDFVSRTIRTEGPTGIKGGIKGSHPISGKYGQYQYLNWAPKFYIDACFMHQDLKARD